jgi:hypothetical protein
MNNIPIAPLMFNAWKKAGLALVSCALVIFVYVSFRHILSHNIKVYTALGIFTGLVLFAMSQEKNETEYILKLRYNAYRMTFNTLFLTLFIFSGWELLNHEQFHASYIAGLIGLSTYLLTFYVPLITNNFDVYTGTEEIGNIKKEPGIYIWLAINIIGIIVFFCLSSI